ncbi:hypothetical protein MLD38_028627 [Melastoma candidum]|uniref:Uncharacterized protein n=1 Tax=Melastoma candidum TaxID=119954 RepID=A0ACB9N1I8_9MYRT|nr:hypothetical protein MLD38_028627 [Melastoma candidum]
MRSYSRTLLTSSAAKNWTVSAASCGVDKGNSCAGVGSYLTVTVSPVTLPEGLAYGIPRNNVKRLFLLLQVRLYTARGIFEELESPPCNLWDRERPQAAAPRVPSFFSSSSSSSKPSLAKQWECSGSPPTTESNQRPSLHFPSLPGLCVISNGRWLRATLDIS